MSTPVVTLTTDFGLSDSYVAQMKGVLLSECPGVQIVDVTHEIPPKNIPVGGMRLAAITGFFPKGTVHVAVVDPGVGGPRRGIAIACSGQFFVGPDNGVLSLAAPVTAPGWEAVELTNESVWLPQISNSFHGRDVFAPVAARLAQRGRLKEIGTPIDETVHLEFPVPRVVGDRVTGIVFDVDRFGNLITNVRQETFEGRVVQEIDVHGHSISGLSTWYDPEQHLVGLINSGGWLEIAAPRGSAALTLDVGIDALIEVRLG